MKTQEIQPSPDAKVLWWCFVFFFFGFFFPEFRVATRVTRPEVNIHRASFILWPETGEAGAQLSNQLLP